MTLKHTQFSIYAIPSSEWIHLFIKKKQKLLFSYYICCIYIYI